MFEDKPVIRHFGDESYQQNYFHDNNIVNVACPVMSARFTQLILQLDDFGIVITQNFVAVLNQPPEL